MHNFAVLFGIHEELKEGSDVNYIWEQAAPVVPRLPTKRLAIPLRHYHLDISCPAWIEVVHVLQACMFPPCLEPLAPDQPSV